MQHRIPLVNILKKYFPYTLPPAKKLKEDYEKLREAFLTTHKAADVDQLDEPRKSQIKSIDEAMELLEENIEVIQSKPKLTDKENEALNSRKDERLAKIKEVNQRFKFKLSLSEIDLQQEKMHVSQIEADALRHQRSTFGFSGQGASDYAVGAVWNVASQIKKSYDESIAAKISKSVPSSIKKFAANLPFAPSKSPDDPTKSVLYRDLLNSLGLVPELFDKDQVENLYKEGKGNPNDKELQKAIRTLKSLQTTLQIALSTYAVHGENKAELTRQITDFKRKEWTAEDVNVKTTKPTFNNVIDFEALVKDIETQKLIEEKLEKIQAGRKKDGKESSDEIAHLQKRLKEIKEEKDIKKKELYDKFCEIVKISKYDGMNDVPLIRKNFLAYLEKLEDQRCLNEFYAKKFESNYGTVRKQIQSFNTNGLKKRMDELDALLKVKEDLKNLPKVFVLKDEENFDANQTKQNKSPNPKVIWNKENLDTFNSIKGTDLQIPNLPVVFCKKEEAVLLFFKEKVKDKIENFNRKKLKSLPPISEDRRMKRR